MSGTDRGATPELGIELPQPTAPMANYVPFTVSGNLVVRVGPGQRANGKRCEFVGKLGAEIAIADGQQAARLCALNILAHLKRRLRRRSRPGAAGACGSAGLSTARPTSPRCRRSSTAPPT